MKKLFLAAALSGWTTWVGAYDLPIQGQWTVNPGPVNTMWFENGTGGCKQGGQCFKIPEGLQVLGCSGTQTLKYGRMEALGRIVAGQSGTSNFTILWQGEHVSTISDPVTGQALPGTSTVLIQTAPLRDDPNLVGNGVNSIWYEYQSNDYAGAPDSNGLEVQAACELGTPITD